MQRVSANRTPIYSYQVLSGTESPRKSQKCVRSCLRAQRPQNESGIRLKSSSAEDLQHILKIEHKKSAEKLRHGSRWTSNFENIRTYMYVRHFCYAFVMVILLSRWKRDVTSLADWIDDNVAYHIMVFYADVTSQHACMTATFVTSQHVF